jgi:hypothetical protein
MAYNYTVQPLRETGAVGNVIDAIEEGDSIARDFML